MEAVMMLHVGATTAVRTSTGDSTSFEVKVGVCQGSAVLSPLLFAIVLKRGGERWSALGDSLR